MTDAEVKALKPGDSVRIFWKVNYRGQELGGENTIQIERIVRRVASDAYRANGHIWAVVTAKDSDKQWVIESDEYLLAMGHVPVLSGWGAEVRRLGAVKL